MSIKNNIEIDFGWIVVGLLIVLFVGEPDIHDAIIVFLMGAAP